MGQENRPPRVFLDTCTLNFIADHSKYIFTGTTPPAMLDQRDFKDVVALRHIFSAEEQPSCELAVSPHTYAEVMGTPSAERQRFLEDQLRPIWDRWISILEEDGELPTLPTIERFKTQLLVTFDLLEALPEIADRILLIDALLYECDYFCTRDRRTILDRSHRAEGLLCVLGGCCTVAGRRIVPLSIVSPAQLWQKLIGAGQS